MTNNFLVAITNSFAVGRIGPAMGRAGAVCDDKRLVSVTGGNEPRPGDEVGAGPPTSGARHQIVIQQPLTLCGYRREPSPNGSPKAMDHEMFVT